MQKNYVQEILDSIHSGLPEAEMAERLSDYHENDIADALAGLTAAERQKLYAILPGSPARSHGPNVPPGSCPWMGMPSPPRTLSPPRISPRRPSRRKRS